MFKCLKANMARMDYPGLFPPQGVLSLQKVEGLSKQNFSTLRNLSPLLAARGTQTALKLAYPLIELLSR